MTSGTSRSMACLALGLAVAGCQDRSTAASAAPGGSARPATGPSTPPSASSASGMPSPARSGAPIKGVRPAPVGGNWLQCYAHFQPRTQPKPDATRLGEMCGPTNAMGRVAAAESEVADGGSGQEHRWRAEAGDCYRIFAVAEPSVADLDVEVFDAKGQRVAFDTTDDRWPIVKPDGPFCVLDAGEYRAVVRAQRGSGEYAIEIWRLAK